MVRQSHNARRFAAPISLLVGAALLLYLSFQSISLDDFDSFSFRLALDHFDIALQQPHPPGFPVYVALGKVLYTLTGDPRLALTLISAIFGAISVGALAWIGSMMVSRRVGILAALWMMLLPGFWLTSELALSDVPGIALMLLPIALLWQSSRSAKYAGWWLITGAGLTGLCLGLRPQGAIPVAFFGIYSLIKIYGNVKTKVIPLRQAVRWMMLALGVGAVAILIWLIPVVSASGGLEAYRSLVSAHSAHVYQIDSLFGRPLTGQSILERIQAFGQGIGALLGGSPVVILITIVVLLVGLPRVRWKSVEAQLCALWFVVNIVQVFLIESLERPRLYLPFVPPLALLVAMGWARHPLFSAGINARAKQLARAVPLLLALSFGSASLPLASVLTQQPAPPVQATDYIAAHFPPNTTLIVSFGSFRAAQVGLPGYTHLYLGQFDANGWQARTAEVKPTYLIILDRDDIWPEAYAALTEADSYVPIEDRIFQRDPLVFPQHSLIRMQVLTPIRLLTTAQLALPPSGEIHPGDTNDGKFFCEGWYRAENIGGVSARWTQQSATIRVALLPVDTVLTLEGVSFPSDQTVTVYVNDQEIETVAFRGLWEGISLKIPAAAIRNHPISTVRLLHGKAEIPSGSTRSLAAAYRTIRFVLATP